MHSLWIQPWGNTKPKGSPVGLRKATYLRQLTQVPLANALINSKVGFLHVSSYKVEGIGSGQEREEFILLGLKVQNLWFWFTKTENSKHLLPHSRFQSK